MRARLPLLGAALALSSLGCLNTTAPTPIQIDCETLATSLTASEPTLTTTQSGLKYRDVLAGTGATVGTNNTVAIHYAGCLTDGTKFDQRTNTDPTPIFTLGVGQVIPGFDEGVTGMKIGGRRQLVIPPELAYGSAGAPPTIPPNATLVFTVDLLDAQ